MALKFFKQHNEGFTLIEILVVFSIVAVLSGIGIASFASYSRTQQLNQTANNIKLLVNEARFNALSAVKTNKDQNGSAVTCGNESFEGYSITVIGNDQVRLSLQCDNIGSLTTKNLTMPKGYAIGNGTTCVEIHFDSLSSTGSGIPCQIVLNGYNLEKTISVDAAGNTSVQ